MTVSNFSSLIPIEKNYYEIYIKLIKGLELDLLDILGYGLDFESDIEKGQPIDINKNYSFIPQRGFRESANSNFSGKDIINIKIRDLSKVSKNLFFKNSSSIIE